MSNREMKNLLAGYVKEKFMTISLIQNARSFARDEIFGDPLQNVMFANGLVDKIEEGGHDVVMVLKERLEVMKMLERVVLSDEMRKQKAQGELMKKKEKIEYVMKWKKNKKNKKILDDGGLLEPKMGDFSPTTPIKFMSGIFISISAAQRVVPHLQRVFQADACHMNFGKYTLYSCYGTTANCNTFSVAMAILFGNEDKEGWVQFWNFALSIHPSLDQEDTTIITDQAKGLKEALAEVLPGAGHFLCSFHRLQNIAKIVKGGNVEYSCSWMFKKLLHAKNRAEISHIKHKYSRHVEDRALKYLNTVPDEEVYPGARCNIDGKRCYMYMHTASSASESMNRANKAARSRLAVDVVSSSRLLLQLCASRYQEKKELAWKCQEALTPHGRKLRDAIFEKVDFRKYNIRMGDSHDDRWECLVTRVGRGHSARTCHFMKEESEWGTAFGGCSCGIPYTDGVPCHHMIAMVKSSRIEGLNPNNAMPFWWTTECWRRQYPVDSNVTCNFDMDALRATPEDRAMKYCPPFAGARKAGRPKNDKRIKSPLEGKKKRKRAAETTGEPPPKRSKQGGKSGGGGRKRSAD
jgi:hypothetical protein